VVGTQNAVNWAPTLDGALRNLLTQGDISSVNAGNAGSGLGVSPPPPTAPPGRPGTTGRYTKLSDAQLIALANQYYQASQRTSSLTEKDRNLREVGRILAVLRSRHSP
jgi:hypothetical protein